MPKCAAYYVSIAAYLRKVGYPSREADCRYPLACPKGWNQPRLAHEPLLRLPGGGEGRKLPLTALGVANGNPEGGDARVLLPGSATPASRQVNRPGGPAAGPPDAPYFELPGKLG
jgi:hypothetical protein